MNPYLSTYCTELYIYLEQELQSVYAKSEAKMAAIDVQ
jgi:hypothetical protein